MVSNSPAGAVSAELDWKWDIPSRKSEKGLGLGHRVEIGIGIGIGIGDGER